MPLSPLPFREVKRRREAAGFAEVSSKGSHVTFACTRDGGTRTTIVPRHREINVATLASILRQAGIASETFDR